MADDRRVLTVEEAARALGISRCTAYDMARRNELPAIRLGPRRIVISRDRFERMLAGETLVPAERAGAA